MDAVEALRARNLRWLQSVLVYRLTFKAIAKSERFPVHERTVRRGVMAALQLASEALELSERDEEESERRSLRQLGRRRLRR